MGNNKGGASGKMKKKTPDKAAEARKAEREAETARREEAESRAKSDRNWVKKHWGGKHAQMWLEGDWEPQGLEESGGSGEGQPPPCSVIPFKYGRLEKTEFSDDKQSVLLYIRGACLNAAPGVSLPIGERLLEDGDLILEDCSAAVRVRFVKGETPRAGDVPPDAAQRISCLFPHQQVQAGEGLAAEEGAEAPDDEDAASDSFAVATPPPAPEQRRQRNRGSERRSRKRELMEVANPVKATPQLCGALGMGRDLCLARPVEMVRKALDGLTWGLHWFVASTLVDSAALGSEHCWSMTDRADKFIAKTKLEATTPKRLVSSMRAYKEDPGSKDLRKLLKHIGKMDGKYFSRYYNEGMREAAWSMLDLANEIYHFSAFVPHKVEPRGGGHEAAIGSIAIAERELLLARDAAASLCKIVSGLRTFFPTSGRGVLQWALDAREQFKGAAAGHLEGAKRVCDTLYQLYGNSGDNPDDSDCDQGRDGLFSSDVCEQMAALVPPEDEGFPCPNTQFAALALWTRFGTWLPGQDEAGDVAAGMAGRAGATSGGGCNNVLLIQQRPGKYHTRKDLPDRLSDIAGRSQLEFLQTPATHPVRPAFIASNTDMLLRAVQLTVRAVRSTLIGLARRAEPGQCGINDLAEHILAEARKTQQRQKEKMSLYDLRLDGTGWEANPTEAFLTYSRVWSDPARLEEFLRCLMRPRALGGNHVLASNEVDVSFSYTERNKVAHQEHLGYRMIETNELREKVNKMLRLVELLIEVTGLKTEDVEEYAALRDLQQVVGQPWRSFTRRMRMACAWTTEISTTRNLRLAAKATLQSLLERHGRQDGNNGEELQLIEHILSPCRRIAKLLEMPAGSRDGAGSSNPYDTLASGE